MSEDIDIVARLQDGLMASGNLDQLRCIQEACEEITDLRSQLAALQPIKIEDMPDEWKDRRSVMMCNNAIVDPVWKAVLWDRVMLEWFMVDGLYISNMTHAILTPPTPPTIEVE
ncbi:MAG: hypothetical protein COA69_00020 [Robiginitomaculum sp.]|nr:MAG: hypothetical protein COA69_00020 [Robiginitomaculum sp.]